MVDEKNKKKDKKSKDLEGRGGAQLIYNYWKDS